MQNFDFQPTIRVIYGENAIDELGKLAKEIADPKRVLIVSDPGIAKIGLLDRAINSLKFSQIDIVIFTDVKPNPTTDHVKNGAEFARQNGEIDLIIGFGGGSSMDCAKGINFVLTNGGEIENFWGFGKATKPMLPSIGVPTTAGTGSEAQSYALISHAKTHVKMAIGDLKARFDAVILDPTLTKTVPRKIAVATGIDAIAHAVESYVSTKRNAISQMFAKEAWNLLSRNFERSLIENSTTEIRGKMLIGSHLAGMAIECSMLGAAHATANPLTANFGITHGVAVGVMLPHVIDLNSQKVGDLYKNLSPNLKDQIIEFQGLANLPRRLQDLHISKCNFNRLIKSASKEWTGNFNPISLDHEILRRLYEKAF